MSDELKRDYQKKLGEKFGAIFHGVSYDWAGESGQRGKRARSPNPTSILANQIRQVLVRRWPERNTGPHQELE